MEPIDADHEWSQMGKAFRTGAILEAGRRELERYLFALATVQVRADFNQQRALQMGETIRLLLARLDSMETERRATRIALVALVISIIAAVLTAVEVAAVLGFIHH